MDITYRYVGRRCGVSFVHQSIFPDSLSHIHDAAAHFCKVSPHDLKPKPLHAWLLLIQIAGALAAYLLLYRFNKIVAEGVMVCIICPTATAAAVITSKLGGSAASLTTYTLLGNIGAAIAVPIFFLWWKYIPMLVLGSILCYIE